MGRGCAEISSAKSDVEVSCGQQAAKTRDTQSSAYIYIERERIGHAYTICSNTYEFIYPIGIK